MDNFSESKKGVVSFGQQFCDKLEHIPIKKRILLRDSALYQRSPSSAEASYQKVGTPLGKSSDPTCLSKTHSDNLKPGHGNRSEILVLTNEKAGCPSEFPCIKTHIDSTISNMSSTVKNNVNKDQSTDDLFCCTESKLPLMFYSSPVAKDDGMGTKNAEHVNRLTSNMIGDSSADHRSAIQPEPSCVDHRAQQSVTQDVRILWDLNVEMDAWEKASDRKNVESQPYISSSECIPSITEDFRPKEEVIISEGNTENHPKPTDISLGKDGICEQKHMIPNSADFFVCKCAKEDHQVAPSTCPDRTFSDTQMSLQIVSKSDEHLVPLIDESVNMLAANVPKRGAKSSSETINYSADVVECESSGNIIKFCPWDSGLPKKSSHTKAGQLEVVDMISSNQCLDLVSQRSYVEDGNHVETLGEKIINETAEAAPLIHHPSVELTKNSPEHIDVSTGIQKLGCFQKGRVASIVEPLCVASNCNLDSTIFKQVPNIGRDPGAQTEQDYEDGELRDLDMECWNETETDMGETECVEYEPVTSYIDNLDDSSTSMSVVGKGEGGLKIKKRETPMNDHLVRKEETNSDEKVIKGLCGEGYFGAHNSNKQLERKLSGWDQLPIDDHATLDGVHETHNISSRSSRSKLQSCIDIPTLSEDAEEKETVLERRIRPKDMDDSYPVESGLDFDKFSGKRWSGSHMHRRNQIEDWDSERRSSVNYHDLYDNHSGSRHIFMNSKGRGRFRSRSPSGRNETYEAHFNYSRRSRGRYGGLVEGSGRSMRGARHGYRGSLTDDCDEPELCVREQRVRRDGSFSPRVVPHFSKTKTSRSRSRTRSPPIWLSPYEKLGSRGHRRSPDFGQEDRAKRTRLPFRKSSFTSDNEMRYSSPPRNGFMRQNKPRWNDNDDFDTVGPRERSPVRSFSHKEKFNATCSRGRSKCIEDFRSMEYRRRTREFSSPTGVGRYIGGIDRRKGEDSYETDHRKHFYKDGRRQYQHDAGNDIAAQRCSLDVGFLEDGETRVGIMRPKESSGNVRYEYDQPSYPCSNPDKKR